MSVDKVEAVTPRPHTSTHPDIQSPNQPSSQPLTDSITHQSSYLSFHQSIKMLSFFPKPRPQTLLVCFVTYICDVIFIPQSVAEWILCLLWYDHWAYIWTFRVLESKWIGQTVYIISDQKVHVFDLSIFGWVHFQRRLTRGIQCLS